jgi:hypothetical protein
MKGLNKAQRRIEARLEVLAPLYKKCWSQRDMVKEVKRILCMESYSLQTCQEDIKRLVRQWRESNNLNIQEYVDVELERIDATVRELWEQWERSKGHYSESVESRKGIPALSNNGDVQMNIAESLQTKKKRERAGDVAYIAEIRAQLIERRKLLGLYAPEKKDVTVNEFDFSTLTDEQHQVLLEIGEQVLNEKG